MSPNHKLAFTNTDSEKQHKDLCITRPQEAGIIPRAVTGTHTSSFFVHTGWLAAAGLSEHLLLKATLSLTSLTGPTPTQGISLPRNCPCLHLGRS